MTYRKSTNLGIVVNGLEDGEIGIGDLVAQQKRAGALGVVLSDDFVKLGDRLVLVLFRLCAELGYPCGLMMMSVYPF